MTLEHVVSLSFQKCNAAFIHSTSIAVTQSCFCSLSLLHEYDKANFRLECLPTFVEMLDEGMALRVHLIFHNSLKQIHI